MAIAVTKHEVPQTFETVITSVLFTVLFDKLFYSFDLLLLKPLSIFVYSLPGLFRNWFIAFIKFHILIDNCFLPKN